MASTAALRRAKAREAAERGPVITVTVDGAKYSLFGKDMTALDVRAMREQVGMSYNELVRIGFRDLDVDVAAAIVWMARRTAGERNLTYAQVAEQMHWTPDLEGTTDPAAAVVAGEEADGPPET